MTDPLANVERLIDGAPEVPNHTPMQPADLRAACEAYLRENGWTEHPGTMWTHAEKPVPACDLGALDVQWARDGIGGAS